jgi:hypothetical protein
MSGTHFQRYGALKHIFFAAAFAAFLGSTLRSAASEGAPASAEQCSALSELTIPASDIGKPTRGAVIESATFIAKDTPGNRNGEFCKVIGLIKPMDQKAPDIEFEVNLPSDWNGRTLQLGGGAYDGNLVTGLTPYPSEPAGQPTPLAAGYVTLGSDSGHKSAMGFDGSFALNDESRLNFGQLSIKKTHDAAMFLVKSYYKRVPKRSYFIGASQGGHEALVAAALYPADYDGVVVNFPAYDLTLLQLSGVPIAKALYDNGGKGWLNPAKVKLLTDAVYATCDKLDGAEDGIISDIAACNRAFTLDTVRSTLRCAGGTDAGDRCLSDTQIATIETINSPYRPGYPVGGLDSFPRWPVLEGALFRMASFGAAPQPVSPPSGKEAFQFLVASGVTKYFITRDPNFDPLTFDAAAWKSQVQRSAEEVDISSASLRPFKDKGGKMILVHGTIDDLISPYNSINYYNRQVSIFGQPAVDSFLRFYTVPGMGHGRGVFTGTYDGLGVLDSWVYGGKAPGTLLTIDGNAGSHRSRPMCVYPAFPKFTGTRGASLDDSSNFICAQD